MSHEYPTTVLFVPDSAAEFYAVAVGSVECPVCESWDVVSFHFPTTDRYYAASCRECMIEWADWDEPWSYTYKYMPTSDKLTAGDSAYTKVKAIEMTFTTEIDAEKK